MVGGRTLVIVPTYNEALNIADVIHRLRATALELDILIVDDNSPDGTGLIADNLCDSQTFVLHRPGKGGLGPAYLAGFRWGFERDYQRFVEIDADGSHQPEELHTLLELAQNSDLVLGTRWMEGGTVINWPTYRRLISRFGTGYARAALGLPYKDVTTGYRTLSRQLVADILGSEITTVGYGFQIEIVRIARKNQRTIVEVPITFIERVAGNSKMSKKIVFEAWIKTTQWGFARLLHRR